MSAEIIGATEGVITARVSGKLRQEELYALQASAADLIKRQGKVRILILAEGFEGWERGGDWGDLSFQTAHDAQIERMAFVGDQKWQDPALLFTAQGLRKFPIEYFAPADLVKARAWLAEP